jgi:hypothetical protein
MIIATYYCPALLDACFQTTLVKFYFVLFLWLKKNQTCIVPLLRGLIWSASYASLIMTILLPIHETCMVVSDCDTNKAEEPVV